MRKATSLTLAPVGSALASSLALHDGVTRSRYMRRFDRELGGARVRLSARADLGAELSSADVVLLGEFHALPSASRSAEELAERLAPRGRRGGFIGLEMVFGRHQPALEAYLAQRISEVELRRRLRLVADWGYPWQGVGRLLRMARRRGLPVLGLDIGPRGGPEALGMRDKVAAERIARALEEHGAPGIVVFGEAHLASEHLPARLRARLGKRARILRLFHDLPVEGAEGPGPPLYARLDRDTWARWSFAPAMRARAMERVLERWQSEEPPTLAEDPAPLVDGLVARGLARVGIRLRDEVAPGFLAGDLLPDALPTREPSLVLKRLVGDGLSPRDAERALESATGRGALFVAESGLMLVERPEVRVLAPEVGRAVAAIARGASRGPHARLEHDVSWLCEGLLAGLVSALVAGAGEPEPASRSRESAEEAARALTRPSLVAGPENAARVRRVGEALAERIERGLLPRSVVRTWLRVGLEDPSRSRRVIARACSTLLAA